MDAVTVGLVEGNPPSLSVDQLSTLATRLFPLARVDVASVKDLVSYDDKNYYFRGTLEPNDVACSKEGEFVFKINNATDSPDLVGGLTSLMTFLSSRGFRVPRPLASRDGLQVKVCSAGELLGDSTCHSGCREAGNVPESPPLEYCVRLFSYIPAELMDLIDKKFLTPKLVYSMGNLLGRLDVALKDFRDEAVEHRVYINWDMAYLLEVRRFLPDIDDPEKREMAERVLSAFEAEVLPNLHTMTRGIIHGDCNGMNILVTRNGASYDITGCIDFGDTVYTCIVFDLAIAMAYSMINKEDPLNFSSPILPGFLAAFSLTEVDLSALYYSVLGRMVQSALTGVAQYKRQPWNDYLLQAHAQHFWKIIREMLELGRERVEEMWKSARSKTAQDYDSAS